MNGFETGSGQCWTIRQFESGVVSMSYLYPRTAFFGPSRKTILLEQCARICFTPPAASGAIGALFPNGFLEVSTCHNNMRS